MLILWEQVWYYDHSPYHSHQSVTGLLILVLRVALALLFAHTLQQILPKERSAMRREFYSSFAKVSVRFRYTLALLRTFKD